MKTGRTLTRELNKIIAGDALYVSDRMAGVLLRPETQRLLAQHPQKKAMSRLNRLLLEDAYPEEISRIPPIQQLEDTVVTGLNRILKAEDFCDRS